jgi:hypothetical protein
MKIQALAFLISLEHAKEKMRFAAKRRASGSSVGKNSTAQSQSVLSCQHGSSPSFRIALKIDRFPSFQTSCSKTRGTRYKDGTTKTCSIAFSSVPYRALQSDRCLVVTT